MMPSVSTSCNKDPLPQEFAELRKQVDFPRGYAGNPMSDDEVVQKFRTLARGVVSDKVQDAILAQCWKLDQALNVRDVWKFSTLK